MSEQRIGVVSDTHGLIWPEALEALQGSSLILHAGDIGAPEVLKSLQEIAPVVAVQGNIDRDAWGQSFPVSQTVEVGQVRLYIIHDLLDLDVEPGAAGFHAVIFGHSHKPSLEMRNGVLFLNPGSAGPRRFRLPVSVAIIDVKDEQLHPRLIELQVDAQN